SGNSNLSEYSQGKNLLHVFQGFPGFFPSSPGQLIAPALISGNRGLFLSKEKKEANACLSVITSYAHPSADKEC
ncbi:MAG: hypothetical protein ABTB30_17460, partial [Clostridia bacterium]